MAFIKIISLPGGNGAACSKFFFKEGAVGEKCSIKVGEVAEVPDSDLPYFLSTGKIMEVRGPDAADAEPKKRGRPAKVTDEAAEIMSYQR